MMKNAPISFPRLQRWKRRRRAVFIKWYSGENRSFPNYNENLNFFPNFPNYDEKRAYFISAFAKMETGGGGRSL